MELLSFRDGQGRVWPLPPISDDLIQFCYQQFGERFFWAMRNNPTDADAKDALTRFVVYLTADERQARAVSREDFTASMDGHAWRRATVAVAFAFLVGTAVQPVACEVYETIPERQKETALLQAASERTTWGGEESPDDQGDEHSQMM